MLILYLLLQVLFSDIYQKEKKNNNIVLLYKVGNIKIYKEKKKENNIFLIRLRG